MDFGPANFGHIGPVAGSPLPQLQYQRLVALIVNDGLVASGPAGPVALLGVYPWPDGSAREAWLRVAPGIGRQIVPLLLTARRALRREAGTGPPIVARIAPGNGAGARLARMAGFVPADLVVEGADLWRLA